MSFPIIAYASKYRKMTRINIPHKLEFVAVIYLTPPISNAITDAFVYLRSNEVRKTEYELNSPRINTTDRTEGFYKFSHKTRYDVFAVLSLIATFRIQYVLEESLILLFRVRYHVLLEVINISVTDMNYPGMLTRT